MHEGAAREASGSWWVVTNHALIITDRFGHPQRRIPRAEIVEIQAADRRNVRVRTTSEGFLIGSFRNDDLGEWLAR